MPYRHLLAAVELDNINTRVVQRAARFAQLCDAQLSLVTSIPDLRALYHGTERGVQQSFDQTLVAAAQEGLEALCRKAGVTPERLRVLRGDPDHAVVEHARGAGVDLIVFGNQDRHGLDHFVGGFGLGLLHRAHCDLLAVNLAGSSNAFAAPLVALGNDQNDVALELKVGLLHQRLHPRGQLAAVHVVRPPWRETWSSVDDAAQSRRQITAEVRTEIQARLKNAAQLAVQVEFDTPSQGIDSVAGSGGHDLIVIGSGKHSPLGWHLGSTAHNLLSRTQHDVLLVRPQT